MAKHRANQSLKQSLSALSAMLLAASALLFGAVTAQAAPVALTVTHIGWDVVGLDSNDVTDGPNTFPQGYRVCNTSTDTAATNVEADWLWNSHNPLINLDGNTNRELGTIAANSCVDIYWTVTVTRDATAYDTSRVYAVTVNDGTATANTGAQSIYVEHLVSQNRNVVNGVTGPSSVSLGDTVQFVLSGATATQGYEQIVTAPVLSSAIFEITSVTGSYAVGGNISNFYYDACGWDPAGTDRTNWACLSTGKAGGDPITVTVTAKVIGTGTAAVGGIIYDFSGSSFHYNSDYSTGVLTVTSSAPVRTIDAVDNAETTQVDTAVEVDVLANDGASNATVNTGSVTITQQPAHGTLSVDAQTGKVTYTPNAGYTGTDSFKYSIATNEDAAITDEATVTITIEAPVVVNPPVAVDDADTTPVDTAVEVDVLTNDTAGSNPLDPTSVKITSQPTNGTVSVDPVSGKITYTPNSGYTGTDNFTYEVCDNATPANCDTAVVTITITAVVNPPAEEVVVDEVAEVDEKLVIDPSTLDPNAPEIDPTTVEITEGPEHGTVTVDPQTGKITYTPKAGYTGTDSFKFKAASASNPLVFVEFVYNVSITGDEEVVKTAEEALAFTGSDSLALLTLALLLALSGVALVVRTSRK